MRTCAERRSSPAFTLIELLVIIFIVAVFGGILLPAFTHAREKARRTGCISNLCSVGMGLEAYAGDYGGYLPCSNSYGANPGGPEIISQVAFAMDNDEGIVTDKNGQEVRTGPYINKDARRNSDPGNVSQHAGFMAPMYYMRTLYTGNVDFPTDYTLTNPSAPIRPAGQFNMAPTGLGFIIRSQYVPDVRAFFCPSAGAMPADSALSFPGEISHNKSADAIAALLEAKECGGYDDAHLSAGTWSTGCARWKVPESTGAFRSNWGKPEKLNSSKREYLTLQSSYNYRNTPCLPQWHWRSLPELHENTFGEYSLEKPGTTGGCQKDGMGTWRISWPNANSQTGLYLRWTHPWSKINPGGPVFQTQRLLADRAIVSDTFSQCDMNDTELPYAGKGIYAHRQGYNVLYGDASSRWFDDKEERLVWWYRTDAMSADETALAGYGCDKNDVPFLSGRGAAYDGYWVDMMSLQVNGVADLYSGASSGSTFNDKHQSRDALLPYPHDSGLTQGAGSASTVWHMMDAVGGVDLGPEAARPEGLLAPSRD